MSRSYKHTPRSGDSKNKLNKTLANRRLRRCKLAHNLQHGNYKKNHEQYDICDFEEVGTSFERYWLFVVSSWLKTGYKSKPYPDKDAAYKEWYLMYKRK